LIAYRWSIPLKQAVSRAPWQRKRGGGRLRVETNLVHDGDTRGLGLLVQLEHGRRDVARRDNILLVADGRLDDGGVEGVGDQADDKIVLSNLSVESLVVGYVERDGVSILDTLGELLSAGEGAAGCVGIRVRPAPIRFESFGTTSHTHQRSRGSRHR
jgi:hypothetical protein